MKKLIKLFAMALSSALLAACVSAPNPPQGELCGINGVSGYKLCFDLAKDFGADGKLKAGVQGVKTPIVLTDLHKGWWMDSASKESLQAYALKWKQRYERLQKDCR